MKIAYLTDARSPIALNWISHLVKRGHEVHVISSYPCSPEMLPDAQVYQFPFAFSGLSRVRHDGMIGSPRNRSLAATALSNLRVGALSGLSQAIRFWLSPIELQTHVRRARELIIHIAPDLVHAMRIPFEGVLAAKAIPSGLPLLISVWGNDFTLFAHHNPLMKRQTRQTVRRADALHCDCRRDLRLATEVWGFPQNKPSAVLPGAGGIQRCLFSPGESDTNFRHQLSIPDSAPVIFNPRGFRSYVRNDVFFKAIPQVLTQCPRAVFVCTGMHGSPVAQRWIDRLAVSDNVRLLPTVSREQMAELFRMAQVTVSPSLHDGTPNTLLEAMACGSFPVAGDIESLREWITDGVNGLLCDPASPDSLARSITRALSDQALRARAKELNLKLIEERADYTKVMLQAEELYLNVIQRRAAQARV